MELIIKCPTSTEREIEKAKLAKDMHLGAAINQRRAVKKFTLEYMNTLCLPCQPVNFPDYTDGGCDGEEEEQQREKDFTELLADDQQEVIEFTGNICELDDLIKDCEDPPSPLTAIEQDNYSALVLGEEFGQGNSIPHFGVDRPQSDYFNSNLMMHLYVQADISRGENVVTMYDERTMGKDKDALCSLRLKYHVEQFERCHKENIKPPKVYISIRDNCVGQNKSNMTRVR